MPGRTPLACGLIAIVGAGEAFSQTVSLPDGISGIIDFQAAVTGGERSWTDGGFGKLRYGGTDGNTSLGLSRGALLWRPSIDFSWDAYVHIEFDPEHDHFADIGEAYLRYRALPIGKVKLQARAGAFYPPVSLEHDGAAWSTTRTITPSAINSWIGEEVKVGGLEGSVGTNIGQNELKLTGSVFGFNDTSGTLLTYRGWALHDRQATLFGDFPVPLQTAPGRSQAPNSQPFREIDGRAGYYARMEWRLASPIALDITHYDNAGDRVSADDGQRSWETRFTNVGLQARLAESTHLLAQAMTGQTLWIPLTSAPIAFVDDLDFASAYVLLDHEFGSQGLTGRIDVFETSDNQAFNFNSTPEDGWAATAAWRNKFSTGLTLIIEGLYISSDRAARARHNLDASQDQLSVQSSLRWSF